MTVATTSIITGADHDVVLQQVESSSDEEGDDDDEQEVNDDIEDEFCSRVGTTCYNI